VDTTPSTRTTARSDGVVAVLVVVVILILVDHATAELLTAVAAAFRGIYSLWTRRPRRSGPEHCRARWRRGSGHRARTDEFGRVPTWRTRRMIENAA